MIYSVLIYDDEAQLKSMSEEEHQRRLDQHLHFQKTLGEKGQLLSVARLEDTPTARTVRQEGALIIDGPFAETKEQLIGFYLIDCASLEEASEAVKLLPGQSGSLEIRPVNFFQGAS